ncbi:hypothetical protein K2F54_03720 [Cryobacterium sp. 1639]|uniref:SCO7613 C-terminal domain-containing membrane protein n=1 Tax=Cryobacterium inferilacus TaxID=2866629 RepID=UPI001C7316B0|nr:hypothetical protein [Cryobacterium sp. 1639]MBX0299079.1 hypothetical protein [Cryobacterium sp. 1639]
MSPSSSIRDFAQYAGRFLWPRTSADLTDTTLCPACRTLLPSAVCPSCGLDLRHPAARDLLTASTDAATALDKRVQLIGQIRYEVAEAHAAQVAQSHADAAQAAQRRVLDEVAARVDAAATAQRAAEAAQAAQAAQAALAAQAAQAAQAALATQAELAGPAGPTHTSAALASAPPASPTFASSPAEPVASAPAIPSAARSTAPTGTAPTPPHPIEPGLTAPPSTPLPPSQDAPSGPPAHKRSSVQIVLLLVGVTLVSVAAIFFLTVAFIVTGLAFRATVVAALTVGTLVTAAVLRRKGLVATAEGIGALAVVLVLLDVWAMRQLNLFGLAGADGLLYWGAALLVCTVLFLGWHTWSSLRVASVAGFAAAAPAVGLLAAGIAADAAPLTRLFVASTGAAVGALLHRFTVPGTAGVWPSLDRRAERVGLLGIAGVALLTATGLAGFVQPATAWAPLVSFGVVALVALAHTFTLLLPVRSELSLRVGSHASVVLAVLAGVAGVTVTTSRSENVGLDVAVPLLVATLIALGLEQAWRRRAAGPVRQIVLTATLTGFGLMVLPGIVTLIVAGIPLVRALIGGDADPITDPLARIPAESVAALAALVGVGVLVTGFWKIGGVLVTRMRLLAWFGAIVLLLAVPFTQWLWLILPLYLLVGAGALAALFLARSGRPQLARFRPQLVLLVVAAEAFGYQISWADTSSWWLGTLSMVFTLIVGRYLLNAVRHAAARGAMLAGAIVFTLIGAAAGPAALTLGAPPTPAVLLLYIALSIAVSTDVLQLLVAQGRFARLTLTERRWAFWTLLAPTLYLVAAPTGLLIEGLSPSERAGVTPLASVLGILASALLVAATLLWALTPPGRARAERLVAALLVAPALLGLATNLVLVTDAPATLTRLTAPTAALLTLALALALRVTGRSSRAGLGLEVGAAVVLGSAFFPLDRTELGWLVLLYTAVAVLITAVDADGLFASTSWRRHLGWLSLVLATAALWWGLGDSGTTPVEAYVLPVAGTVLALAALLWRYGRVDRAVAASPGAALLTLAGLSLALLPLALTGQTGSVLRPIIVGAVSAALLLGATVPRWTAPRWAFLAAAGLAGALGLLVTAVARSVRVIGTDAGPLLEAWLLPTTVILIVAALLLVRRQHTDVASLRRRGSLVLVLVALVTLTALETSAFDTSRLGAGRATALVLLLSLLHVLALSRPRPPFGALTAWTSLGLAGLAASAALIVDAVDPFEVVLVPVGLALVAGQLLSNRPWTGRAAGAAPVGVGGGLALTLLPSAAVGAAAAAGATTLGSAGLTDDALRQLLTLALGGVLALGGAAVVGRPRWSLVAWPGVLVGCVTIVVTATGRIRSLLGTGPTGPDGLLEAWLLPAALLLVVTGALIIRAHQAGAAAGAPPTPTDAVTALPRVFGYALVSAALLGILAAETASLAYPPYAAGRALALIGLFATLHIVLRWTDRSRAGSLLAWFSLAAGVLALTAGLGRDLISPIEWGTVPLGLSLVVGQLLVARRLGTPGIGAPTPARPAALQLWLGVGLALALLPSVIAGFNGDLLRPVLTLVAGCLLLLGGAWALTGPDRAVWSALARPGLFVGTLAVLLTAAGRIQPLFDPVAAGPDGRLEAWLMPTALLLIAAGAILIVGSPARGELPGVDAAASSAPKGPVGSAATLSARMLGYGLILLALAGIVAVELAALTYAPLATIRVVLVVWLFAALYLGVFWADDSRPGRLVAWVSVSGAAAMIVGGWAREVPDPVEIVTIPLALALIASGLLHLDRTPAARSWGTLSPGLLVLLLPSLVLDLTFSPLWRVVGLGVLAIAVLVLGTVQRLQAPFLIGATVLLVHALAQLWPWISLAYGAVPWWLWLGIGGVLLIALAARYEQRIQNLKTVALRISALR